MGVDSLFPISSASMVVGLGVSVIGAKLLAPILPFSRLTIFSALAAIPPTMALTSVAFFGVAMASGAPQQSRSFFFMAAALLAGVALASYLGAFGVIYATFKFGPAFIDWLRA